MTNKTEMNNIFDGHNLKPGERVPEGANFLLAPDDFYLANLVDYPETQGKEHESPAESNLYEVVELALMRNARPPKMTRWVSKPRPVKVVGRKVGR